MKLKKLYKQTTTGAIQTWVIEVDGDKFRTISGQLEGAKITNKWTVCKGKNLGRANATTAEEQALKEAEAKHQKKREKGYTLDINKVGKKKFYEPMLANKFADKNRYKEVEELLSTPHPDRGRAVLSQPKLDGIRCVAMREGLFTRTGKKIVAVPHIHEELKPFFELYPNAVLDGELYNHAYKNDFNKIIHLVRKQKLTEEHLMESKEMIQYYIYDAPVIGNGERVLTEKSLYSDRMGRLDEAFLNLKIGTGKPQVMWNPLLVVQTTDVEDMPQLDELYEDYLEEGFEGQMVRVDGPYENKRSSLLLKRKEFTDEEYTILGYEEGQGNRVGTVKHLKFRNKDGRDFKSNVKGSFEYLSGLFNDADNLIGKEATIKYFNLTPDGVPRFPYVTAIRDYE